MTQFDLCHCCGKSEEEFETRLHYLTHLQIAEKCNICDKYFVSKRELNSHTKNVHERKVKCDCCDKVNDLERDSHGERLRNCVVDFNTKNL